jgi:hypothetical protein
MSKKLKLPATREMGTQCDLEDMLEPMGFNVLNHRMCFRRVRQMPLIPEMEAPSVVDFHFSSFRDLTSVFEWASMLSSDEVQELADGFLGTRIAGVPVKGGARTCPRLVVRRFVEEAVILCGIQEFRDALVSSTRTLFFRGFCTKPFNGRSLFALVDHDAQVWAPVMHTALDFVGRLIHRSALPGALSAELLQMSGWMLNNSEAQCTMHVVSMIAVLKIEPACPMPRLARSASTPSSRVQSTVEHGLVRADTAPPALCPKMRSVGTLLRLQDDLAPHCCVSFEGVIKQEPFVIAEAIPLDIPVEDLSHYWHFAAGGEHKAANLAHRAQQAEVMAASK